MVEKMVEKEEAKVITTSTKEDEAVISKKELEDIEREVLGKDKERETKLKQDIKEEMEAEQRLKLLEETKVKLEAAVKQQAEDKVDLKEKLEKEITELKEQVGTSKGVVNVQSPFVKSEGKSSLRLDSEKVKEIDEESKKAFLEKMGLAEHQWG